MKRIVIAITLVLALLISASAMAEPTPQIPGKGGERSGEVTIDQSMEDGMDQSMEEIMDEALEENIQDYMEDAAEEYLAEATEESVENVAETDGMDHVDPDDLEDEIEDDLGDEAEEDYELDEEPDEIVDSTSGATEHRHGKQSDELAAAFKAFHKARMEARLEELEEELDGYVEEGSITQEQADLILDAFIEKAESKKNMLDDCYSLSDMIYCDYLERKCVFPTDERGGCYDEKADCDTGVDLPDDLRSSRTGGGHGPSRRLSPCGGR